MPALVNKSVGSLAGTSGLDATTVWPFDLKKSRKLLRISLLVIFCSIFDIALQGFADVLHGEPALLQKTRLPGAFLHVFREFTAKSLAPGFRRAGRPAPLVSPDRLVHELTRHTPAPEFLTDLQGAGTATHPGRHEFLHEARVREELLGLQRRQHRLHGGAFVAPFQELAAEFLGRVLAPREERERLGPDPRRVAGCFLVRLRLLQAHCRRPGPVRPRPSWAPASRGCPPRSRRRSPGSASGSRGRLPFPGRSSCPCSCTRPRTSPPGCGPRPAR